MSAALKRPESKKVSLIKKLLSFVTKSESEESSEWLFSLLFFVAKSDFKNLMRHK